MTQDIFSSVLISLSYFLVLSLSLSLSLSRLLTSGGECVDAEKKEFEIHCQYFGCYLWSGSFDVIIILANKVSKIL
jgi:hypothetical protein